MLKIEWRYDDESHSKRDRQQPKEVAQTKAAKKEERMDHGEGDPYISVA